MADWSHLAGAHVVRLNATLHPNEFEPDLYRKYGLAPIHCEPYTPDEIIPYVENCDALFAVSVNLPTRVIESLQRCKVISRLGTGTDKIDVATATAQGIIVTNVPTFCVHEQADHTMMLLLALERKLPQMIEAMREGAWRWSKRSSNATRRLAALTLGLIGFGNSARETARRARAFGMRVIATRRNMDASRVEADALGVSMVDLDTVLRESDYVSLHLPLSRETYHLLDEDALRKMKPTARLINTSRGALVDELVLAKLLREKVIAGAGIDTFEHIDVFVPEERPPDHPFMALDNVILTPHTAGLSVQAKYDVACGGVQNVASILSGHWPHPDHIVNQGVVPWFTLSDYNATLFEERPPELVDLTPVRQRTLGDEVADRVRDAIRSGELRSGQRLVERALAEQLGVSRVPVREAIQRLAEEGLVRKSPHRGTFVYVPTRNDIEEISSLRVVLERFVVERAIARWAPDHEARLRQIIDAMRRAGLAHDIRGLYEQDYLFHSVLWEIADHDLLLEVVSSLRARINRFLHEATGMLPASQLDMHISSHEVLVELIAGGDVALAQAEMTRHVLGAKTRILTYYELPLS